jgi:hypothetical protein
MEIIRAHNTPNKVTLYDGTVINRDKSGKIWIPEWGTYVACAPYSTHFLFEVPARIPGASHLCSCGSEAVIVGSKAYSHLSSHEDAMMVCQIHTQTNRHADGVA